MSSLSKCQKLHTLLCSDQLEFILEAHNGLSAKIVEEAGFKGIWASGFALSAQYCVRDSNEASWTQVIDMLEFMSDATNIPILLDGDTGYGNFNNMQRLVMKLEQRGIAGVCIEDKEFPKTNSFIAGEKQSLADIDEFCGKIKAGKDQQSDDDFCIVARVEALIAGWGLDEAMKRAEMYHQAGADAILIHSALSRPDQILAFAKEWAGRAPLVIVPTRYYSTPTDVFRAANISLVIWANHMVRATVATMQKLSKKIKQDETVMTIEDSIADMQEVFRLQGVEELSMAEERYLRHSPNICAIILAASRGSALRELTHDRPKVMLSVGGKVLLNRIVDECKKNNIHQNVVVAGYQAETVNHPNITVRVNEDYHSTNELASLVHARQDFQDEIVILYGDLLFRKHILRDLLECQGNIVIVVDSEKAQFDEPDKEDIAYCTIDDDRSPFMQNVELSHILSETSSKKPTDSKPSGRWIGMLYARTQGRQWIEQAIEEMIQDENFNQMVMADLLNHLVAQGRGINVHYIHGHWMDINDIADMDKAGDFT